MERVRVRRALKHDGCGCGYRHDHCDDVRGHWGMRAQREGRGPQSPQIVVAGSPQKI